MSTPHEMQKLRRTIGERAFAATLSQSGTLTKGKAVEIARAFLRNGATLKATAEAILHVAKLRRDGLNARRARRNDGKPWSHRNSGSFRTEVIAPSYRCDPWARGSLSERLTSARAVVEEARLSRVRDAVMWLLAASHIGVYTVRRLPAGAPLSAVGARAWSSKGDQYSRRCTWRKTEAWADVAIPADYEATVVATGLGPRLDGMLTLAALPVESDRPGEEVFRAVWARKTSGFAFVREEGYIVRRDGQLTHGSSVAAARSTLTRRATEAELDRHEAAILAKLSGPAAELNGLGGQIVAIRDSVRAGNCEAGTLAFRDQHFPGRDSASIREVLTAAETTGERKYAIAACMVAVRRHARESLATAGNDKRSPQLHS
jgi:hypothetical protein